MSFKSKKNSIEFKYLGDKNGFCVREGKERRDWKSLIWFLIEKKGDFHGINPVRYVREWREAESEGTLSDKEQKLLPLRMVEGLVDSF